VCFFLGIFSWKSEKDIKEGCRKDLTVMVTGRDGNILKGLFK